MLANNKNILRRVDALQIKHTKFYSEHFLASYSYFLRSFKIVYLNKEVSLHVR